MQAVVVIGAGGFGRETLDVIEAVNRAATRPIFEIVGVVDDAPSALDQERLAARGIAWIGTIHAWLAEKTTAQFLIGIGNPIVRTAIDARLISAGRVAATVIHPNATIGSRSVIGAGTIVCSGAEISTNVTLGANAHINPNATVGHDTVLADCVSINPGAVVSGDVSIGPQTLIGAAAVILQGLSVGTRCVVGASACVTRDVADESTIKGVPAR